MLSVWDGSDNVGPRHLQPCPDAAKKEAHSHTLGQNFATLSPIRERWLEVQVADLSRYYHHDLELAVLESLFPCYLVDPNLKLTCCPMIAKTQVPLHNTS